MTAPANTVPPAISGTVALGNALALSDGTWDNVPTSFAYAWLRAGVVIAGEISNSYTVALADLGGSLVGRVTASNVDGAVAVDSAASISVPTTLIVETGAGVPGANTYSSRTAADLYHMALGNIAWAALSIGAREAYLKKAAAYMQQIYRGRWKGFRVTATQPLDWPRSNVELVDNPFGTVVASDAIPAEVISVQQELALRASVAELAPDLTRSKSSVKVGEIAVTYDQGSPEYVRYRALDMALSPYLTSAQPRLIRT